MSGASLSRRDTGDIGEDIRALELRRRGMSYYDIGEAIGHSKGWAFKAVRRALALTTSETADEVRQMEVARLEALMAPALDILHGRHLMVSQGRVVLDPDSGEPLADPMPVLHAIDRLVRISESLRVLRGTDAPKRSVNQVITVDALQAEIIRVRAEIEAGEERAKVVPGSVVQRDLDEG